MHRLPTASLLLIGLVCCQNIFAAPTIFTLEFLQGIPYLIDETPIRCAGGMAHAGRPFASVLKDEGKTLNVYGGKNFRLSTSIRLPAPADFLPPPQVGHHSMWGHYLSLLQPIGASLYQFDFHDSWGPEVHSIDLSQRKVDGAEHKIDGELLLANPSPWQQNTNGGVFVAFNPKEGGQASLFHLIKKEGVSLEGAPLIVRQLEWEPALGSKLTAPIWKNYTAPIVVGVSDPNRFPEVVGFNRSENVDWIVRLGKDTDQTSLRGKRIVALIWASTDKRFITAIVEIQAGKKYQLFSISDTGVPLSFGTPLTVEETLAVYEALPRYKDGIPPENEVRP